MVTLCGSGGMGVTRGRAVTYSLEHPVTNTSPSLSNIGNRVVACVMKENQTITILGQYLYLVYLCTVYFRSTSIIGNFMYTIIQSSHHNLAETDFARTQHYQICRFRIISLVFHHFLMKPCRNVEQNSCNSCGVYLGI